MKLFKLLLFSFLIAVSLSTSQMDAWMEAFCRELEYDRASRNEECYPIRHSVDDFFPEGISLPQTDSSSSRTTD